MKETHYEATMREWGAADSQWESGLALACNVQVDFSGQAPETKEGVDSAYKSIEALKAKGIPKQLAHMIVTLVGLKKFNFSLWDTVISQEVDLARTKDTSDSLRKVLNLAYHLYSHYKTGKRVYEVSENLGKQLKNTELRGLYADDIRLPYKNIYISVPHGLGFEVTTDKLEQDFEFRGPVLPSHRNELANRAKMVPVDGIFATEDVDSRGCRHLHCLIVSQEDWSGYYWFSLTLDNGMPVDDCVTESIRFLANTARRFPNSTDSVMAKLWPNIFKWVLNVIMYATCSNPGEHVIGNREAKQLWERIRKLPKESKKRRELLDRAKHTPKQERILLGGISVDRSREQNENAGVGSSMTVRTLVCGHWRKQAHGKGRSLRKHIWIEPFWRGPDMAPVVAKRHVLKNSSLDG